MANRGVRVGPVLGLRREIDRLFEDTLGPDNARGVWTPPVDIREAAGAILIEVELPGTSPEDVDVMCENGILTIRGEKRSPWSESGDGRYHVIERSYGTFTRSFQLPTGADEQRIEAEFLDGVLVVRVPKAVVAQPRRIEILRSGGRPMVQGTGGRSPNSGRDANTLGEPVPPVPPDATPKPNVDSGR